METQLKNRSSGALMGSPAAAVALRPSTDSASAADEDDTASFFDLELVDGDGPDDSATDSDEETVRSECNLAERRCCSTGNGGGALISDLILASPSDDLFFKGRLRPLDPASSPASKAGGKLRILMLGFKKPRTTASDTAAAPAAAAAETKRRRHSNFFVKFKAEEVPIMSLFTRDSSSKSSSSSGRPAKVHAGDGGAPSLRSEEKRPSDALQRYLSKIKPLYVRVSKRYGEKMRLSGTLSSLKADTARSKSLPAAALSGGGLQAGMKVSNRRLGKSRSASSAVAAVQSPPSAAIVRRRDDSLLEQEDGIQSAIAHCKRSFNSGREEGSTLP